MLHALRRRTLLRATTAIGLVFFLGVPAAAEDETDSTNPAVPILRGLDRASRLYLDNVLRFACKEKIVEHDPGAKRAFSFDYMYVYDDAQGYLDYRTQGSKSTKPVDPRSVGVRQFLARGSMWVLIFNQSRFSSHRYRLVGGSPMHGIDAIKVEFEPLPPYVDGRNDWFGTAWVDPNSYQLLHVEAMKASDHRLLQEIAHSRGPTPIPEWITDVATDFEVVKNGIRFPSRVIITSRQYLSGEGRPLRQASSTQTYSNYRFYGVRTSEEVRTLLGLAPLTGVGLATQPEAGSAPLPGASPPSP
ncbi:MAG TPA: hypothetical protein VFW45_05235 [Candidatus Polarisedimenticolia bacterium]|nr:hypothetical protein [Candidatus Polarisedimenticolia bacterium]